MKSKVFNWTSRTIAVLVVAVGTGALAQSAANTEFNRGFYGEIQEFSGVIDAYSPQTAATATAPANGPYEIHGPWTLKLNRYTGRADFSAAVNMELSDGWALTLNKGNFDPNARGAHTHHITLVNADFTESTNTDGSRVIQISGLAATVTLNGGKAPVSPTPLVIEITGGTNVRYSNISLTFGTPGSKHFGPEPLPGVVQSVR